MNLLCSRRAAPQTSANLTYVPPGSYGVLCCNTEASFIVGIQISIGGVHIDVGVSQVKMAGMLCRVWSCVAHPENETNFGRKNDRTNRLTVSAGTGTALYVRETVAPPLAVIGDNPRSHLRPPAPVSQKKWSYRNGHTDSYQGYNMTF